jgi:tRNA(Ile2) C34 agmatinyltransferase TiaS
MGLGRVAGEDEVFNINIKNANNSAKPMPEQKKSLHLQRYKDVTCPVCGKFLFRNKNAKGQIVYRCKQCKQTVTVKL